MRKSSRIYFVSDNHARIDVLSLGSHMAVCHHASPARPTGMADASSKADAVICPVCIDEILVPVIGTKSSEQTTDRAFVEIVTLGSASALLKSLIPSLHHHDMTLVT